MNCPPKKRICDSCHTPGDASGEGARCLPGTQPAPRPRRATPGRTRQRVWTWQGGSGQPWKQWGADASPSCGARTQRNPHGACWSPQEGGRQRLTRGQSLSCWGCVRLGRNWSPKPFIYSSGLSFSSSKVVLFSVCSRHQTLAQFNNSKPLWCP